MIVERLESKIIQVSALTSISYYGLWVFNTTLNNISLISWQSILIEGENSD